MILKSIIINGFKSFGKKVTIDVTHNVTGVVGPNGSGKSNVAEAIRFVLGEQSMKNMRSKLSADLIFKGSNSMNGLSRASVEIVIDNKIKSNTMIASHDLASYLDYDEIRLGREVYIDGESKYKINDAVVRLKDVQELLAIAGIGNSAHTLISQGEADRVLLSSPKDRREIIEDALGLKVYHLRIKESEKKLLKVEEHKKEIEIIKRELRPQMLELGRMVKTIDSRRQEIDKLELYVRYYAHREREIIKNRLEEIDSNLGLGSDDRYLHMSDLESLKINLDKLKKDIDTDHSERDFKLALQEAEKDYLEVNNEYNQLVAKKQVLTQIQLSHSSGDQERKVKEEIVSFARGELSDRRVNIDKKLDNAIYNAVHNNNAGAISNIGDAKDLLNAIFSIEKKDKSKPIDYSDQIYDIENKLINVETLKHELLTKLSQAKKQVEEVSQNKYNKLKEKSDTEIRIRDIEYAQSISQEERRRLAERKVYIDTLWAECIHIIGSQLLIHQSDVDTAHALYSMPIHELHRSIEKSRMRIDDSAIAGAANIVDEYNELMERDRFLDTELSDIDKTDRELRGLIETLRYTLRADFIKGIDKISFVFNNYFHEVFAGGRAKLSLVVATPIHPLSPADSSPGGALDTEVIEDTLEIDVSLPDKKVKDLHMLSGGERSLVSIALIFAMSSIAPPPFIVLDETDAALDELNAKRYGKMLDKLAERSKLLVITHNRATMNECDVLYGVTLGSDGASKILSIKFER